MNTKPFSPASVPGTIWYAPGQGLWQDRDKTIPATRDGDPVAVWESSTGGQDLLPSPGQTWTFRNGGVMTTGPCSADGLEIQSAYLHDGPMTDEQRERIADYFRQRFPEAFPDDPEPDHVVD